MATAGEAEQEGRSQKNSLTQSESVRSQPEPGAHPALPHCGQLCSPPVHGRKASEYRAERDKCFQQMDLLNFTDEGYENDYLIKMLTQKLGKD